MIALAVEAGLFQQWIDNLAHLWCGQPIAVTLQLAFARHLDDWKIVEQAKLLQHGTVSQSSAEITKAFIRKNSGNIATKRLARVLLEDTLLFAVDMSSLVHPLLQPALCAQKDKLVFYIALMK